MNKEIWSVLGVAIGLAGLIWMVSGVTEKHVTGEIHHVLKSIDELKNDVIAVQGDVSDMKTVTSGHATDLREIRAQLAKPSAAQPEPQTVTRLRNFSRGETNDHCAGSRNVSWTILAEKGWEIDVTSIKAKVTVQSSRSSYGGIRNRSSQRFEVFGRIANNGECIRVLGKTVARDGRGTLRVAGTYVERQVRN